MPDTKEPGKLHIMIIEDEIAVGGFFAEAFKAEGHTVEVHTTGESALAAIAVRRPDAVFLDLKLPKMSGTEVLRAIRSRDRDLRVVVITGRATDAAFEETALLGITDFIEKPLIIQRLSEALRRLQPP